MKTMMRATLTALLASAVALLATGCQQAVQPDSPAALQEIGDLHSQFLKAFNAKDAAGVAATYSLDAMLMPPNTPAIKTRIAIQFYMSTQLTPQSPGLLLNTTENVVMGNYGYSSGYYTMVDAKGATLDHGKFLEILSHDQDGWHIYRDIYNSDNPVPQPAAMPAATAAPAAATH